MGPTACKTFTATRVQDRETLGEKVTAWLRANPAIEVVRADVVQSSDNAFHCLSIVLFYRAAGGAG